MRSLLVLVLGLTVASACSGRSRQRIDSGDPGRAGSGTQPEGGQAGEGEPAMDGGSTTGGGAGANAGAAGGSARGGSAGGDATGGTGGGAGASPAGAGGLAAGAGGFATAAGGGEAGSGGLASGAGGKSGPSAPLTWSCSPEAWDDGRCHCGCGAIDWDCREWTLEECEVCDDPSSCSGQACPGTINPALTVACVIPFEWRCPPRTYHDGSVCDCGCYHPDPDCASPAVESCDVCDGGCAGVECPGPITVDDNTTCTYPEGWRCSDLYGDGVCDCGCGVRDFDCPSAASADCSRCEFGCAEVACPGTIALDDNSVCSGPPPSWTCAAPLYADGALCHCGCGTMDPDCAVDSRESCDVCDAPGSCSSGSCPGTIQETHIDDCFLPPLPPEWTCSQWVYADNGTCDCGCGAMDLDCESLDAVHCRRCPTSPDGCSVDANCGDISPTDNAHCSGQ